MSSLSVTAIAGYWCVVWWSDLSRVFLWTSHSQHRQSQAVVAELELRFLEAQQKKNTTTPHSVCVVLAGLTMSGDLQLQMLDPKTVTVSFLVTNLACSFSCIERLSRVISVVLWR